MPKAILYKLENEIKAAYELNFMRIVPKYTKDMFTKDYIDEIILESYREGHISKGFFQDYTTEFSEDSIIIKIPFLQGGIDLLGNGSTAQIISDIIFREFGIRYNVSIAQREDYKNNIEMFEAQKLSILKNAIEEAKASLAEKNTTDEAPQREEFKKSNSFNKLFFNKENSTKNANIMHTRA